MSVPSTAWDESVPAGSRDINLGDNDIRSMKTQIREIVDVDHKFDSSGQDADMGKHKKVSLLEQADLGTGATGKPILGGQTVSGKPELVFTDEDDNDVQLTSGGKSYVPIASFTAKSSPVPADEALIADTEASDALKKITLQSIMEMIYPVGSVYINATDDTNPGTLLGFGTWTAFGAGRVPVGFDSGDTDFDEAEETGGAKTHTLTTDEMPAHTHTTTLDNEASSNTGQLSNNIRTVNTSSGTFNETTDSTGGGSAHNNMPPYITVFMFKRTA